MKPIVTGTLAAVTVLSLTANVLLYMRYSTNRPLVTIGHQVISKKDYQDQLDYQTQGSVLKKMVLSDLVNQAAIQQGVEPTDADVTTRLAMIQRTTPQVLNNVGNDPTKMAAFKEDLKTELALENLRIRKVSVTPAQVTAFYDAHKQDFAVPKQVQTTLAVAPNSVDAASAASLLKQNIALNIVARQPGIHVVGMDGFTVNMQALPPSISKEISTTVFHMQTGDVKTIHVGKSYLILKVKKDSSAGVPSLAQIRPEVTRMAKLENAVPAAQEVSDLYKQMKPQFAVSKYADYFDSVGGNSSTDVASAQ